MSANAVTPEDSVKNDEVNAKVDNELQNKQLKDIQNNIEELKHGLEKKEKSILKLEIEKELKEGQLSSLQNLLDSKLNEYVTLDVSRKAAIENETDCKNKLKTARIHRMASILEYTNEMAKLRKQLFSPSNLDEGTINGEIEYLIAFYDELNEKNKTLQFEIDHISKRTDSEAEANDMIDKMQLLIKQMNLETVDDRKLNEEMQMQIMVLDKKIREMNGNN